MPDEAKSSAVSVAGWKKAAKHLIMLPSGAQVVIKIPDLPALIEAGNIPQTLMDAAISAASGAAVEPTKEMLLQMRKLTDELVKVSVVEPTITDADLKEIPYEDKELIGEIALRQRDTDAAYRHIGGLEKIESFRAFRGFPSSDEDVEDA